MTNNVKHTHPNWLQLRQCLQEFIKTTRSNNTSNSWINGFNSTVYWCFLVSTTVTISSEYVYQLSTVIVKSGVFLRGPCIPHPLFVLSNMTSCAVIYSLAAQKGVMPPLYNWCRYLLVGRNILHWHGRQLVFHSNMWVTYSFHSPHFIYLALPAMTQFSEWQHSSFGSLSTSINGYRHHPSASHTCSFQGLQPNHFTCGLHLSSVDTLVDIHDPSHNFLFFHPREALLVGGWVTALPSFSCGILFPSPPEEVVLHGVGLVHLSHVWQLPINKGTPTSDVTRRSQFQWRTCDYPCWLVTS